VFVGDVRISTLDVSSDESVEAAVNELMRLEGRIDLLVNNAGFGVAAAGAEVSSIEQARWIFETNFFGIVIPYGAQARWWQVMTESCPRFNGMDAPLLYGINRARVEVMN
jgi:NAD(P)-dependent dehydrogenase (short-subunit alcohol dehydrogenase family)